MSRRFEGSFVAVPLTRMDDPKEVIGLARDLKIETFGAVGLATMWEAFVLAVGDQKTGRVRGYTADQLAARLGWPPKRPARELIEGLKRAGLLKQERNRDFVHPYWENSTTGIYAAMREERRGGDRERKRAQREREMLEEVKDVTRDVRVTNTESGHRSIEGHPDQNPPDPPEKGGAGFARWENLKKLRPLWCVDSRTCIRVLDDVSPAHWEMIEWFVRVALEPKWVGGPSSSKKIVLANRNSRLLCTRANYIKILPIWQEELGRRAEAERPRQTEVEKNAENRIHLRKYANDCLAHPESTEAEKERARRTLTELDEQAAKIEKRMKHVLADPLTTDAEKERARRTLTAFPELSTPSREPN